MAVLEQQTELDRKIMNLDFFASPGLERFLALLEEKGWTKNGRPAFPFAVDLLPAGDRTLLWRAVTTVLALLLVGMCMAGSVTLAWDDPDNPHGVDGYRVYTSVDLITWTKVAETNATQVTIHPSDGTYYAYVTAFTGTLESHPSNMLTFELPPCPRAPVE